MSKLIVGCPDCGDQCEPCDKVLLDAEGADVGAALERSRVVGVLDAWADAGGDWTSGHSRRRGSYWVVLCDGERVCFNAASPDAARALAAKAIEAEF